MAKLYFRFGTVGSGKTLSLLNIFFSYKAQEKTIYLIKPAIDVRFGERAVRSRTGLEAQSDVLVRVPSDIAIPSHKKCDLLLVDESQFLCADSVDKLRALSIADNVPVICFGLRTDFRAELFAGSKRLLEIADQIEEIKSICQYCTSKAIFNLRTRDGHAEFDGPVVELGGCDIYQPVCANHYFEFKHSGTSSVQSSVQSSVPEHLQNTQQLQQSQFRCDRSSHKIV